MTEKPTVVYPTVESVEKELAEKEAKHRQEMKHLRALLRVLQDKEATDGNKK